MKQLIKQQTKKYLPLSSKGVSSLEMVSAIAIFTLVSLVIGGVFITLRVAWNDTLVNVKIHSQTIRPLDTMIKELKEADPSSPIGITIDPDPQSIIFAIPNTVGAEQIDSWFEIDYVFDPNTNEITRTIDGADTVIAKNVNSLLFTRAGTAISINISVSDQTADGKILTTVLTSQVAMRN